MLKIGNFWVGPGEIEDKLENIQGKKIVHKLKLLNIFKHFKIAKTKKKYFKLRRRKLLYVSKPIF